jgi:cytochrome b pre-mRNA-processing protein 3
MLQNLFGGNPVKRAAESLYSSAVRAARNSVLYTDYGVPDTVDGRFEMIALHVYVLLRRLKTTGPEGKALSQTVFDSMFDDMDRTLREMGAGDLAVGRRVKEMAQAFYGRIAAYDDGIGEHDAAALQLALERNVFRSSDGVPDDQADRGATLAHYLRALAQEMDRCDADRLLSGHVTFPELATS